MNKETFTIPYLVKYSRLPPGNLPTQKPVFIHYFQFSMLLYRADRKGNQTMPEKFGTDGLLTKQINSGDDPEPHKKYGWISTIVNHIHESDDPIAKGIYDTTAYLSFTTDRKRQEAFLAGRDMRHFRASNKKDADAYVFTADIDISCCIRLPNGIYLYEYRCNYEKGLIDPNFRLGSVPIRGRCNLHTPSGPHILMLIDAVTYLFSKQHEYPKAYSNAKRDSEWLLMPCDPMIKGPGYQARIPVADFWLPSFFSFVG